QIALSHHPITRLSFHLLNRQCVTLSARRVPERRVPACRVPSTGIPSARVSPTRVPSSAVRASARLPSSTAATTEYWFFGRMFGCPVLLLLVGCLLLSKVWMERWSTSYQDFILGNRE
ncbi:hypothetical protein M8C21_007520, partial [Ambrosia artemisiifolia]